MFGDPISPKWTIAHRMLIERGVGLDERLWSRMIRVEPPQHDCLQHAQHHGCEVRTPYTARAVIMLAPDHWVAQDALRGVLVHGDFRTIDTYRESVPMVVQAAQHFLLGEGQGGLLQMRRAALLHLAQFRLQSLVALGKGG